MPKIKKNDPKPKQNTQKTKPSTSGNVHKLVMNAKSFISFDAFEEFTHDKVMDEQVKLNKALNIDANNAMVESMVQISTRKTWNSLINKEISNPKTSAKKLIVEKTNYVLHMYWCCICGKKDKLLECTLCCTSYHDICSKKYIESALGFKDVVDSLSDTCPICLVKGIISSGTVVWHKMKTFPWWPAVILPSTEGTGLKNPPNPFYRPVLYYGSKNYGWAHEKQMCFFDINYDVIKNKNDKSFQLALKEAQTEFDKIKSQK